MTMRFFTKNRIENFQSITVSSGDTSKANIYDRVSSTKWQSVSSNDTVTESIEVVFGFAQLVDHISLLNHNFKQFTIQYWNGGAYVDFSTPINETVNADANSFYSFTQVSTLKLKITATKSIIANAQKYLGEFLAYVEQFNLPDDDMPDNENLNLYYKQNEHEKVNGGSIVVIEATANKYQNVFTFNALPKTYRDYIKALKDSHQSFWFMPDDGEVDEQYYCNLIQLNFNKILAWTIAGERCYQGSFDVKET